MHSLAGSDAARGEVRPVLFPLAYALEVRLDRLLRGPDTGKEHTFDVRNRRLKELCRQVDQLQAQDQEMICRFLDMSVRHNRLKELVGGPLRETG